MKPTYTETDCYGDTFYYSDSERTILHREDGPAIEWVNGGKEWYYNGQRHREDGPAIEHPNGRKEWYFNGKLHREDGPASEWADGGGRGYYINGKRLTEEEFEARKDKLQ